MDPVSAIVTTFPLRATVALKNATEQARKDAHTKLKALIRGRYAKVSADLDQLEQTPDSTTRRAVIEESLTREGAQQDPQLPQLAAQAQTLIELVRSSAPEA